jgi:hypothetical protein
MIATIKSVTCPLALNDVSHEADSGSGFDGPGLGGSGFGGGWFFMLGYDWQGHGPVNYGCLKRQAVRSRQRSRAIPDFSSDRPEELCQRASRLAAAMNVWFYNAGSRSGGRYSAYAQNYPRRCGCLWTGLVLYWGT